MEDIIALGLLYKYIVTGEKEIREDVISSYIAAVSNALRELGSTYDINYDKSRFSSLYELNIDEKSGCYSFKQIDYDIFPEIYFINKELMMSSLSEEALSVLDIKLDDLPVETRKVGEREYTTLSVYDDCVMDKIALLRLEQEKNAKRLSICSSMDRDEKIKLDELRVAETILVEEGVEKRAKQIAFIVRRRPYWLGSGGSVFLVDFFSDEVMTLYFKNQKKYDFIDIFYEDYEPLDKVMQARYATIEEIEEFAYRLNEQEAKKELRP